MAWFNPAWEALTDGERTILTAFYLNDDSSKAKAVQCLCDTMWLEKTAVYYRKDKAVAHLALLLYGK